ncbi:[Fe-Fe] hydrogenase large subunit C-terminal domain-containing protein [Azotosporobacter soli]|uniref:[Fe-Fe] hydrogenase large subunit C-terminal domain-containing protein n=1 Tax=Azotosporobacter soli TaxID=3055040 RepID=UPI0031FF099C
MQIIKTQKVNCRDCHRCVRSCPVKAIGINGGQARVIDERCILCGRCVVECPQKAKTVLDEREKIHQAMAAGKKVVISLAPSFAANFDFVDFTDFKKELLQLGFSDVFETAVGADIVAQSYRNMVEKRTRPVISACCPIVVKLICNYYPELVSSLAPVVSPMIAHAKLLREQQGEDIFIVFAGPCIGKIDEAQSISGTVDAVITFERLKEWMLQITPNLIKQSILLEHDKSSARTFPLPGGILQTMGYRDDSQFIAVDGIENVMAVLSSMSNGEIEPAFIEMLACSGGCVGGPVNSNKQCWPIKKGKVNEFIAAREQTGYSNSQMNLSAENFSRTHTAATLDSPMPKESEIRAILQRCGKNALEDQKNCGACGYNSCREKAIAVFQGLAETDMCVPYMRSKAESLANMVVENSPNAIIVVDESMLVQEANPTAYRMFTGNMFEKGDSLLRVFDCTDIVKAIQLEQRIIGKRVEYTEYGLVAEQTVVPLKEHGFVLVVFADVTEQEKRDREWERMKFETMEKATEIINRQMKVAQEIAGLLGETTAETKAALLELTWLLRGKEDI